MLYLMTLGWPWFAGCAALGAVVGYVATPRDRNGAAAGGWLLIALVLALAAGAAVSAAGVFEGRMALTLDIGLFASGAYVLGMPLGRALKLVGASSSEGKRPAVVTPIIVNSAPVAAPVVAPKIEAPVEAAAEPALDQVVVAAAALKEKAAIMRVNGKPAKAAPGVKPATLAAPRGGVRDDLARIKGLGPKSVEKLNALGVFHYDQIAGWSRENARWVGAAIGAAGRVERDNWVAQAQKLAGVQTENAA